MNRTRGRLVVACLAVIGAAIAVAGGSAGNRTAEVTFQALPGASVTSGENLTTTTTFKNTGKSMFTHVELRHVVPVGTAGAATLVASSCNAVIQGNVAFCSFGKLGKGATAQATFVWQTPSSAGCSNCVTPSATWTIKEGKPTNGNENFPTGGIAVSLLGGDGSSETKKAGGYETAAASCTAATGNLHTNQALSSTNPVASTVCLPTFTIPPGGFALGYSSTIDEITTPPASLPGSHPELGQSVVCVAALGQACAPGHTPVNWGTTNKARHIFRILHSALSSGPSALSYSPSVVTTGYPTITKVFHNGVQLPKCADDPSFVHGCVVSITGPSGYPKIWTVVADAPGNGPWNW